MNFIDFNYNMAKKVTVSVALFNNAYYVERCIHSVINQTYRNLEILIIDDGSNDGSLLKVQNLLNDERIIIISKKNEGLSSSRQRGLENASGDYICFIDADDFLHEEYIEKLLQQIELTNSDICICSTKFIDQTGNDLPLDEAPFIYSSPIDLSIGDDTKIDYTSVFTLSDSWNKMYRVSFLRNAKVAFNLPKGYNGSDFLFNHKVFFHKPQYTSIQEKLYIHVNYRASAVRRKNKKLLEGFIIIVENLFAELNMLGKEYNDRDIAIISNVYADAIKVSSMDIYSEIENDKVFNNVFKQSIRMHKSFLMNHNSISSKYILNKKTFVFYFCFTYLPPIFSKSLLKFYTRFKR